MNISFADIGIWCNGNTTDSGPVIPGSSPGIPTIKKFYFKFGIWCNGNTTDSGPVIPGSSPGIPTHTVRHLSVMKGVFFLFIGILFYGVFITINPRAFALGFIVVVCSARALSNGCKSRVSPNSGNYIAKGKGVHREVKSERSRRQTSDLTNRNFIQGI